MKIKTANIKHEINVTVTLSGPPGCGKSTVKQVLETLLDKNGVKTKPSSDLSDSKFIIQCTRNQLKDLENWY